MLAQGAKQLSLGPARPFDGTPVRGPGAHRHQGHWCGGTEEENQPPEPRHVREAPNGKREYDQAPSNQRNQGPLPNSRPDVARSLGSSGVITKMIPTTLSARPKR